MSDIIEALFISLVGMGAVFLSLTVIMFLMVGIERIFRGEVEEEGGMEVLQEIPVGRMPVGEVVEPVDTVEVAAIALALAAYLHGHGKELGRASPVIGGVQYRVEVGDISYPPVFVKVNGDSYWAGIGGEGLPVTGRVTQLRIARRSEAGYERSWRSAYTMPGGAHWDRRGWSRKI